MEQPAFLSSGKGHRDENFPVASFLISRRHRPVILAFYRFARTADDVADHPTADPADKLRLLDGMRRDLLGEAEVSPEATGLRQILLERNLPDQQPLDLLEAFRRDVTKLRYADWNDLMDYCRYSAMPVGRFVLDVHGESRATWPASDALCSALQVINHLQDCAKDYRNLDRVYIPLDVLHRRGLGPDVLAERAAAPALRATLDELLDRVSLLLDESRPFAEQIRNRRLALEVAVIQKLAEDLARRLRARDPLSQRVHHTGGEAARIAAWAAVRFFAGRGPQTVPPVSPAEARESVHGR
ncbi:MAG TPA: squalene synthase HpnC [Rhizomicrobium sp.]|jgi:squalene synthase HpnC